MMYCSASRREQLASSMTRLLRRIGSGMAMIGKRDRHCTHAMCSDCGDMHSMLNRSCMDMVRYDRIARWFTRYMQTERATSNGHGNMIAGNFVRSEEHTSELKSLMRNTSA